MFLAHQFPEISNKTTFISSKVEANETIIKQKHLLGKNLC
jgi:hypothetical protein